MFGKRRSCPFGHRDLENIESISDQRVVADDRDDLGQAGFAQCRDRLVERRVREAPRLEQFCADAINERFVFLIKARRLFMADRLDRRSRDTGLLG